MHKIKPMTTRHLDATPRRGPLVIESAKQEIAGFVSAPYTVLASRVSSSSTIRTSLVIGNLRDDSFITETPLPRLDSDEVTYQYTDIRDESDSRLGRETGGPYHPQHTISNHSTTEGLASDDHAACRPSPPEAQISGR